MSTISGTEFELDHCIMERPDAPFRSERFLRFFAAAHDRERAHIISAKADGVWAGLSRRF